MQQPPRGVADAPADLQRRALSACAAAAQMGQHRGDKDHRHQQHRHVFAKMHGLDDGVGVLALHFGEAVQPRNEQSQHRQQVQDPRVRVPRKGSIVHADVEQRPDHAADAADKAAHRHPLDQCRRIGAHMGHEFFQPLHRPPPSFPGDPPKFSLFYTIFVPPCQSTSMHFPPKPCRCPHGGKVSRAPEFSPLCLSL